MKRKLFLPVLLIFVSCTTLNMSKTIAKSDITRVSYEVTDTTGQLVEAAGLNKYEELREFFLPTFKNNYIVNVIEQYNLSELTFVFSDVEVISPQKARNTMIINYGNHSSYYSLTWKKTKGSGEWKISNVAEKK